MLACLVFNFVSASMKLLSLVLALGVAMLPQVAAAYGSVPSFPSFSYVTASQLSASRSTVESAGLSAGAATAASAAALSIPGASGAVAGSASASFGGGSGSAQATSVSFISAHVAAPVVVPVVHPTPAPTSTPTPTPTPWPHQHGPHAHVLAAASASASATVSAATAHAHAAVNRAAHVGAHARAHAHTHTHAHTHGQAGLSLDKADNRDGITHPGHTFRYTLTVTNTGSENIHDLEVRDFLPEALELMDGETAHWTNVVLEAGATKVFTINVRVKSGASFGEICNVAVAESRDHHVKVEDSDCITITQAPAVKGISHVKSTPVLVQPAAPKVAAASVVPGLPVPVTAQTGAGLLGIGSGAALLGALGLYLRRRIG